MDDIGKVEEDLEEDMELGDPEQRAGSVAHDVGEEAHPHETAEGLGGTHSVNEAEEIEDADQVTGERSDFIPSRQETTHVQQTQGNEQEIQIDEQEASSHSPPQPLILRTPESQQAQSSYHLEDRSNQDDQQEEDPEVTLFKLLTNTLGSGSAMKQSTIYDARGSRMSRYYHLILILQGSVPVLRSTIWATAEYIKKTQSIRSSPMREQPSAAKR